MDRSSNSKGSGARLILVVPDGSVIEQALRFSFQVTNNEAEYEALLAGLRVALELGEKDVKIHSDS